MKGSEHMLETPINKTKAVILHRGIFLFAAAMSLWVIGSSVFWTIRYYNPVPFWDMWTGYVNFSLAAKSGEWGAWFVNHNEHRLLIPRLFFYADFWVFSGTGIFLQLGILLVQLLITYFLAVSCEELCPAIAKRRLMLFFLISVATFSWLQYENFVWAFQIQFGLLYLFVILSFLAFSRATAQHEIERKGVLKAAFFASCSAATMANGLLVFPLLSLWALSIRRCRRIGILFALISAAIWVVYFKVGYQREEGAISLAFLLDNPVRCLRYLLAYLGIPVVKLSLSSAIWAGGGVLLLSMYSVTAPWARERVTRNATAIWILLFVVATGMATALGRAHFGMGQVFSPRYATPALIAWVCAFSVSYTLFPQRFSKHVLGVIGVFLGVYLCWNQLGARNVPYDQLFAYRKAALSLALNAKDSLVESTVIWDVERLRRIAQEPVSRRLTVFGRPWLLDPMSMLGRRLETGKIVGGACQGKFERLEWKEGLLVASGWQGEWSGRQPEAVLLADENLFVVGAAVTGQPREHAFLPSTWQRAPQNPGWQGYVVRPPSGRVSAYFLLRSGGGRYCVFDGKIDVPKRKQIEYSGIYGDGRWVGEVEKIELNPVSWRESAYYKGIPMYRGAVYGSYVDGDVYVGELSLLIKTSSTGEVCLPYITGPAADGYTVKTQEVDGMTREEMTYAIQKSDEKWSSLCYRHPSGQSRRMRLVFRDQGVGFGQWMAVSVMN